MQRKNNNDWFKIKRYTHIGEPLSIGDRRAVESYVKNKEKISSHAFFPLIQKVLLNCKYKQEVNKEGVKVKKKKPKERPICYCTHLDSAIYSYYSFLLSKKYESYLKANNLSEAVIAYRKIKTKNNQGKCNIHFAKEVFDFIKNHSDQNDLAVIVCDIKGFFQNLEHKYLKERWKEVIGAQTLEEDIYAIYKSVIKYSYVEEKRLFYTFKEQIVCQNSTGTTNRNIKRIRYLRDKNAIAYCLRSEIKTIREKGLILKGNYDYKEAKYTHKGIPQGLPISAILANVYMINFDKSINEDISTFNGLYRRYSDDIVIVCPSNYGEFWVEYLMDQIKNVHLEIEESKTNLFYFNKKENNTLSCSHSLLKEQKSFEYLGFSFDGKTIRLKSASLCGYYQRLNKSVKRGIFYGIHSNNTSMAGKLFENRLVFNYTKLGARRYRIYVRDKEDTSKFIYSQKRALGNYWTYVKKAAFIMESPAITRQLRNNKKILYRKIIKARERIKSVKEYRDKRNIEKYGRLY